MKLFRNFFIALLMLAMSRSAARAFSVGSIPRALIPVADGSEEIEFTTIVDVLARGGVQVVTAGVNGKEVRGSHGLRMVPDHLISEVLHEQFDLIACPGGMPGAEHLRDSAELRNLIEKQFTANKLVAAICASPAVIFSEYGILANHRATCYPGSFQNKIPNYVDEEVVVDGNIVTSQGPATAMPFALKLVELLRGEEIALKVKKGLLFK